MSKFVKGFLLVAEVEPFLEWWQKQCGDGSSRPGKGLWQMAQVHVQVDKAGIKCWEYHPITRDANNLISISDETKLLVQEWKQVAQLPYTDTRMLDWIIENGALVEEYHQAGKHYFYLSWPDGNTQKERYVSAREAIMAEMRAEGQ